MTLRSSAIPTSADTQKDAGTASARYQSNAPGKCARKRFCTTYVVYAPIMMSSPWAMLMTPMRP